LSVVAIAPEILKVGECYMQDQSDPFSLVADELSLLSNRLRLMVVAKVWVLDFDQWISATCREKLSCVLDII